MHTSLTLPILDRVVNDIIRCITGIKIRARLMRLLVLRKIVETDGFAYTAFGDTNTKEHESARRSRGFSDTGARVVSVVSTLRAISRHVGRVGMFLVIGVSANKEDMRVTMMV